MSRQVTAEQLSQVREILAQLDRLPTSPEANRRIHNRVNVRLPLDVYVIQANSRPTLQIFSRNLTTSGIGCISRRLFKKGDLLAIEFHISGPVPKLVLSRITFCRYLRAGLYEAGAEFLEAVTPSAYLVDRIPPHWVQMATMQKKPPTPAAASSH